MKNTSLKHLAFSGFIFLATLPALAELSKRDLTVEVRQVEEGESAGYSVGTQSNNQLLAAQRVQVRNGEKATLSMGKSIPMQWVQSVSAQSSTLAASGTSASSNGGSVTHALTWMDAGQNIKVHPRWPGAKQPVSVEVEVQSAHVSERIGVDLPEQSRHGVSTTVSVALGQWVTIAASGSSQPAGVYGTEAPSNTRRLLQLRVSAP